MQQVSKKWRNVLIIIILLCLVAFGLGAYRHHKAGVVFLQTVTGEWGPTLTTSTLEWVATQRSKPGISGYWYEGDGVYELIIVDNRYTQANLYLDTTVRARQSNQGLVITIEDQPAVDDSNVEYNQETYFILKDNPKNITLRINNEEQNLTLEKGTLPITE